MVRKGFRIRALEALAYVRGSAHDFECGKYLIGAYEIGYKDYDVKKIFLDRGVLAEMKDEENLEVLGEFRTRGGSVPPGSRKIYRVNIQAIEKLEGELNDPCIRIEIMRTTKIWFLRNGMPVYEYSSESFRSPEE